MVFRPTIPDEIMVEILLKLPIKSILRCKTLSKHYYSLIHSQFFIDRHLDLVGLPNRLNDRLIASPMRDSLRLFNRRSRCFTVLESSSSPVNDDSKLEIIGPVDGLYCVVDHRKALIGRGITIWNRATSEEYILPLIPATADKFVPPSCLGCGFGYDQKTHSYKIVTIYTSVLNMKKSMLSMYIFDVSERTWRNYNEEHDIDVLTRSISTFVGVFLRGACHWIGSPFLSSTDSTVSLCYSINKIIAFDISMESSRAISLPDVEVILPWSWCNASIVTLNGCLGLIDAAHDNMDGNFSFSVWVMAEYGVVESWSMIYRVSLLHGFVGRSLGIIGDRLYVSEGGGWIVSYDLDSKDGEHYVIWDSNICSLLPYEEFTGFLCGCSVFNWFKISEQFMNDS